VQLCYREIARRFQPQLLQQLSRQVKRGVILIAGTNGKTTTSLLYARCWNAKTGALPTMLQELILKTADHGAAGEYQPHSQPAVDYAILEVDEECIAEGVASDSTEADPVLEFISDQLDRYGDTISQRWRQAIATQAETVVVVNADDPTLSHLGQHLPQRVLFFG